MVGMLEKIVDSFLSKIGEKLFDYAEHTVRDITDYESTFQALRRKLKALSVQSSDVEEELNSAVLSGKKKRKREVENWLEEVKELGDEIVKLETEVQAEGFVSRFLGGGRAAELKERVVELVEQRKHFGELVLDARETGEELLTTRLVGKAFEENLGKVENFLRDYSVKSIGIYGMGGVGKTTLTMHINNKLVKENQNCVFWVTVSQESSIRVLQDKISHVLGLDLSDENDEEKRAARLNRALSSLRKNVVLILDDVWENINLEKVGDPLSVDGCRLIITTRSSQVCRQIGCQQEISVKTLDTDESWNLFSEKLGQEITTRSPDVKSIAKSMAELCDGLPLGIITLAGSMKGETDICTWRNALEELHNSVMGHDEMEDKVFKVLKYSFDRLDPKHQRRRESNEEFTNSQHCFLYCCLYPEDWNMRKSELVRKFISEELVDKRKTWGAQLDEGHAILNKLVNVCLLESSKDSDEYNCVKMHDLIRAMALKITQGKYKVLALCQLKHIPNEDEFWMKEKISLMQNYIEEIPDGFSSNCPNLSTLLLQGNRYLEFIANSFFSQMHGLCVLDLSDNERITKLPISLSKLESLKALILRDCSKLVYVPYLGRLKALKALDLSNTAIKKVPQRMKNLLNLNFLSLDSRYLKDLPKGLLLKFPYLQCLHLPYHIIAPIDEIETLEQLEEFKGRVNDVYDFNRLIRSRQQSQSQSRFIKFAIKVGHLDGDDNLHVENNNNEVILKGCNLSQEDMPIMFPDNVQHLKIGECEGLSKCLSDDFPKFNNPKSLEILKIDNCDVIECIMEKQEIGVGVGVALPTPAQAVFSSLTKLYIVGCPKMKKLGLTGSELRNIVKIYIGGCEEIEEIIEGDADVVLFPKLRSLIVSGLPRLKSIYKGKMKCDSIKEITISSCPELKRIPLYFRKEREAVGTSFITSYSYSPPPALREINLEGRDIEEWWDSLEWEHPDHKSLLRPFVKFWNYENLFRIQFH